MKIKWNYKIIYKTKYEITYIQRNQVVSFHQENATRNTQKSNIPHPTSKNQSTGF